MSMANSHPETAREYQGLLRLDRLPTWVKFANWAITLLVCLVVTASAITRALSLLQSSPELWYVSLGALIWAAMLGSAWLRTTGLRWRYALSLLVAVPVISFCGFIAFAMLMFPR